MVRALVVPLLLSLGLAGSGLAQEGPKAGVESGERALRRASFLAPDSAFAVSMAGVEGQEDVSGAVGAGAVFAAPAGTWARLRRAFLADLVGADAPELGLAARIGATGWSVGVHAGNQDGTGYVAVADLDRDAAAAL
ncbi:MAG: hypothetical protein O3C51_16990, partial [Planctomycetota bacterium]|nr:hypothetical protein [Planctomycetota bacterium]